MAQDGKPTDKTIPGIWGQQAGYIYIQLRDFKRGDRKSDIMQPIASSMERDDMQAYRGIFLEEAMARSGPAAGAKGNCGRRPRAPTAPWAARAAISIIFRATAPCRVWRPEPGVPDENNDDFRSRARGNNPGMSDLMLAIAPDDLAALEEYLSGLDIDDRF